MRSEHCTRKPLDRSWAAMASPIVPGHETILALAQRSHSVVDILAAQPPHSTDTYYFGGKYYPAAQADDDFKPVYHALQQDIKAAGYPTLYNSYTKAGFQLDHMSAHDWIDSRVPGGRHSAMGELLDIAYNIEYGAATSDQSALNLIYLLGFRTSRTLQVFGASDEHYHLKGGNESLPRAIAASMPANTIQSGNALKAITREPNGTYRLDFQKGPDVTADRTSLRHPFSVLRTLQYFQAGFSDLKAIAIQQLGLRLERQAPTPIQRASVEPPGPLGTEPRYPAAHGNTGLSEFLGCPPQAQAARPTLSGGLPGLRWRGPDRQSAKSAGGSAIRRRLPASTGAGVPGNHSAMEWPGDIGHAAIQSVRAGFVFLLESGTVHAVFRYRSPTIPQLPLCRRALLD